MRMILYTSKSAFGRQQVLAAVSYLIHYGTMLQNATVILLQNVKSLLQNMSGFLLQNESVQAVVSLIQKKENRKDEISFTEL